MRRMKTSGLIYISKAQSIFPVSSTHLVKPKGLNLFYTNKLKVCVALKEIAAALSKPL